MKSVELKVLVLFFYSVSSVFSLDFQRLSDDCLEGASLQKLQDLTCTTSSKGVKIHQIRNQNQTFYCINYEKKTGNRNEFDVLTFDLSGDYDLKYTGSNVISNDEHNPKFKLFDARSRPSYKGKLAFSSENLAFDIIKIFVNDLEQICYENGHQIWPSLILNGDDSDDSQESTTQKVYSTSTKSTTPSSGITSTSEDSCGQIRKVESFGNFHALSSSPDEFPWTVSIYRYFNDDDESFYKCAGTIIDRKTILTSVNCLLDDGLLLKSDDLKVYAAPFSLSAKMQRSRLYDIAEIVTHFDYNFNLDNNIAALKLSREIAFNDYVQPICVPETEYSVKGKIGKLAGFGKSSANQPKSDLLTAAEYEVKSVNENGFDAENTSGNNGISDIGSGLYINETNRWTLAGIMSKKTRAILSDVPSHVFTFTNVPKYNLWIKNLKKP